MNKKRKGQSIIDFVVLTSLVVGLIFIGVYKFGDNLANFFAAESPEKRFNSARTIRFERPQDLISNVSITLDDGTVIIPPVEKVIKDGLAAGTYIDTSGSVARIAEMAKIMVEYANQLLNLATTGVAGEAAFITALNDFKTQLDNGVGGGLLGGFNPADDQLTQKLHFIEMSFAASLSTATTNLSNAANNYIPNIPVGNRHDIIENFTNDLLGAGIKIDYYIDPYLYVKFLGENKQDTDTQDQALINAINAAALTPAEELSTAGQIKVYYSSGYSQTSPSSYNGERMCSTYGGTMTTDTSCEIATP